MGNPSLDAYQQVFGLACIANRAGGYNGTGSELQLQLQYDLSFYLNNVPPVKVMGQTAPSVADSSVTPILGDWNLVWGPALIEETDQKEKPTGVADNALFVAQCDAVAYPGGPTLPTYVVAVAATNPASLYDWETEDFSVAEVVNWTNYNPVLFKPSAYNGTDPYISNGTATGIKILLSLTSPPTAASPGTTLEEFIASLQPGPQSAIVFCGHSLAGALSPTLALYLKQHNQLDAFGVSLVYPTAGPTPGESAFANLFNNTFPPLPEGWTAQSGDYQSWNTMHWNTLDVVPHAWHQTDLQQIAQIYGQSPNLLTRSTLNTLQRLVLKRAATSGANYTRIQNQSLPGTLQHADQSSPTINTPPKTMKDYITQLFLQHVSLYSGIPAQPGSPAVQGLILPQPLPQPVYPPGKALLPGVKKVTSLELIIRIMEQILAWIASYATSLDGTLPKENSKNSSNKSKID
ncbi:lipase family protein [Pedobacter sp. KBS0701]|uniref:lipase family protein n=1 Tax=Pedobacter sp. KBS0701 TaxID=2578106 RepID=UPI00110DC4FE|nr:lipase family protein [Pedobacter sp. KBS0701]QDW23958.1 lipase family protein [Pedobacter sp. KBS0701]